MPTNTVRVCVCACVCSCHSCRLAGRDYTAVVLEKLLEKRGVVVALMSDRRGGDDGSGTDSDDGRDVDWLTYGFQVLTQVGPSTPTCNLA